MFLSKLRLLRRKLKKFIITYTTFTTKQYKYDLTFENDYTYCFYPTIPERQIHFNVYNIYENKSQHVSAGTLLKPHFIVYHNMKKLLPNMQKIIFLYWLFMEELRTEPFYFYIKFYNNIIFELLKQMRIIFHDLNLALIVSKPLNITQKSRKRIKKKIWKMLVDLNDWF